MDDKMLRRQITRYGNDEVRFKAKADRCYAAWKEYGEKNDYLNSQRYYAEAERARKIRQEYEKMLQQQGGSTACAV